MVLPEPEKHPDEVADGRHLMDNEYDEVLFRPDGVPFYSRRYGLMVKLPVSFAKPQFVGRLTGRRAREGEATV